MPIVRYYYFFCHVETLYKSIKGGIISFFFFEQSHTSLGGNIRLPVCC